MTKLSLLICGHLIVAFPLLAGDVPPDMERLRDSYTAAVDRAVTPLTRSYLIELTKLRDTYTRSANLKAAILVDNEIQAITKKLAASGRMTPVSGPGQSVLHDARATIPANDPNGYRIGPVRKGDHVILTYLGGLWKDHGGIATTNPDIPNKDDKSQLVIAAPADDNGLPGALIKMVPTGTSQTPFDYEVQTDREAIVLRINANSDSRKNPGEVIYQVKLMR